MGSHIFWSFTILWLDINQSHFGKCLTNISRFESWKNTYQLVNKQFHIKSDKNEHLKDAALSTLTQKHMNTFIPRYTNTENYFQTRLTWTIGRTHKFQGSFLLKANQWELWAHHPERSPLLSFCVFERRIWMFFLNR